MDTLYEITRMTESELQLAVNWAAREGWNSGIHDALDFHQLRKYDALKG
ncbi:MAG: hypothetical protein WC785_01525 [Tatlockia sp.]|jgi:hypothetical protein